MGDYEIATGYALAMTTLLGLKGSFLVIANLALAERSNLRF